MRILDHFQHLKLTKDQHAALENIQSFLNSDERIFILKGYAGSGKTTLLKGIMEHLKSLRKNYQLMAPTGRAAKVINQKTGYESTTIHKGIYSFDELHEIEQGKDKKDVSFLYQYKLRNNTDVHNSVLIVDEASMISDILSQGEFFRFGSGYLLQDLIEYSRIQVPNTTSKIIFIGDPAQLPPIGMNDSPALSYLYLREKYQLVVSEVEMKEVKRQDADNAILHSAGKIRKSLTSGYFNDFDLRANERDLFTPPYKDFLSVYNAEKNKKIIICYKNKTALDLNTQIRNNKFGRLLPIQATDIIIIGSNNYQLGIMNGEFAVVSKATQEIITRDIHFNTKGGKPQSVSLNWRYLDLVLPDENNQPKIVSGYILENYLYGDNFLKPEEQIALYIDFKNRHPELKKGTEEFKEAIKEDKFFNCILLKYGYAVTCHKAQGGEWPSAFVFWDKGTKSNFNYYDSNHDKSGKSNADFYRWAYTAITRASQKLYCINPPYFSSFSGMKFIDIEVQNAFDDLTGQNSKSVEVSFNEVLPQLEKFGLPEAPLSLQDHFIQRWYGLKDHNIEIERWERLGYEVRYYFRKGEQTAAFKYWINGKNKFKTKFLKFPTHTNSDELFETISEILESLQEVIVDRNNAEGILTQIEFDHELEEEMSFLKNLFDSIAENLSDDVVITNVKHLSWKERYTFEKNGCSCVVDFEYNGKGFFGRVLPIIKESSSPELLSTIAQIVNKLKKSDYVI